MSVLRLATTDKMNNLYAVPFRQRRVHPLIAPDYVLIEFDGNPGRCQAQLANKIVQRGSIPNFPIFAIELNQQFLWSRSSGSFCRQDDAA
jgi:hypothetical protein